MENISTANTNKNVEELKNATVRVASVGSPSSSSEITLDLTNSGRNSQLVGATVAIVNDLGANGEELGLGTVTEVITRNKWHEDSSFRGARDEDGVLQGFSGESGDQREAKIKIQASWYRKNTNDNWIPSGTQLGMSPATGTSIILINQNIIDEITKSYKDLHYNGELGGSDNIPLPLNIPDNATSQGALHYGIFGRSGSGKALWVNTPIPTPKGWVKMGDLKKGDEVFSETGTVCNIIEAHPVQLNKKCYNVHFSDGETITADAEHLWEVTQTVLLPDKQQRNFGGSEQGKSSGVEESQAGSKSKVVLTTEDMFTNMHTSKVEKGEGSFSYSVSSPGSVNFKETATSEFFNSVEKQKFPLAKARELGEQSFEIFKDSPGDEWELYELFSDYILGNEKVRGAFTEGVFKKNGELRINEAGEFEGYYFSNNFLHTKLASTLLSLSGYVPEISVEPVDIGVPTEEMRELSLKEKKPKTPDVKNARRKRPEQGHEVFYFLHWAGPETSNVKKVLKIEEVDSVPVRCISVDSPNHLYLAGRTFIPTHNTASACYVLAGQLRHKNMGMVIVDPQGQWAAENSLPFSFQGFAEELGRKVTVSRVSEELRLREDADLFQELLNQTKFYNKIRIKHTQTQEVVSEEIRSILDSLESWSDLSSEDLLRSVLNSLMSNTVASRIYTTDNKKEAFQNTITGVLENRKEFNQVYQEFSPIANLFQEYNSSGGKRKSFWGVLEDVFKQNHENPSPVLVVDMSSKPPESNSDKDDISLDVEASYRILDNDGIKATILRNLFSDLKRSSEEKFRNGENLNTMIVLDEAWRYAAPLSRIDSEESEISKLSKALAGYARDTRKFGISWFYISQSPRSINSDIWEQIHIFMFGTGLNGLDLDKATESYEDRFAAMRLYKRFGNPAMTGIWPFLLQGPVSPLMSANAPLVINMYTNFDDFRADNDTWIREQRDILGKEVLSGLPKPPMGKTLKKGFVNKTLKGGREALDVMKKDNEHSKHLKDVGISDPESFTDPLAGF